MKQKLTTKNKFIQRTVIRSRLISKFPFDSRFLSQSIVSSSLELLFVYKLNEQCNFCQLLNFKMNELTKATPFISTRKQQENNSEQQIYDFMVEIRKNKSLFISFFSLFIESQFWALNTDEVVYILNIFMNHDTSVKFIA